MDVVDVIIVVPTSGNCRVDNQIIPKPACQKRLKKAIALFKQAEELGQKPIILLLGGNNPANPAQSEAVVARRYLRDTLWSERLVEETSVQVLADGNCTARDMAALDRILSRHRVGSVGIWIVSHPWHFNLARLSLRRARKNPLIVINPSDSGEDRPFGLLSYLARLVITTLDPHWRWLGWPLTWRSKSRQNRIF